VPIYFAIKAGVKKKSEFVWKYLNYVL